MIAAARNASREMPFLLTKNTAGSKSLSTMRPSASWTHHSTSNHLKNYSCTDIQSSGYSLSNPTDPKPLMFSGKMSALKIPMSCSEFVSCANSATMLYT